MSAYLPDRPLIVATRRPHPTDMRAHDADARATRPHRDIGPVGAAIRLFVGGALVGDIVYGELATAGISNPSAGWWASSASRLSCWSGTSGGFVATQRPF